MTTKTMTAMTTKTASSAIPQSSRDFAGGRASAPSPPPAYPYLDSFSVDEKAGELQIAAGTRLGSCFMRVVSPEEKEDDVAVTAVAETRKWAQGGSGERKGGGGNSIQGKGRGGDPFGDVAVGPRSAALPSQPPPSQPLTHSTPTHSTPTTSQSSSGAKDMASWWRLTPSPIPPVTKTTVVTTEKVPHDAPPPLSSLSVVASGANGYDDKPPLTGASFAFSSASEATWASASAASTPMFSTLASPSTRASYYSVFPPSSPVAARRGGSASSYMEGENSGGSPYATRALSTDFDLHHNPDGGRDGDSHGDGHGNGKDCGTDDGNSLAKFRRILDTEFAAAVIDGDGYDKKCDDNDDDDNGKHDKTGTGLCRWQQKNTMSPDPGLTNDLEIESKAWSFEDSRENDKEEGKGDLGLTDDLYDESKAWSFVVSGKYDGDRGGDNKDFKENPDLSNNLEAEPKAWSFDNDCEYDNGRGGEDEEDKEQFFILGVERSPWTEMASRGASATILPTPGEAWPSFFSAMTTNTTMNTAFPSAADGGVNEDSPLLLKARDVVADFFVADDGEDLGRRGQVGGVRIDEGVRTMSPHSLARDNDVVVVVSDYDPTISETSALERQPLLWQITSSKCEDKGFGSGVGSNSIAPKAEAYCCGDGGSGDRDLIRPADETPQPGAAEDGRRVDVPNLIPPLMPVPLARPSLPSSSSEMIAKALKRKIKRRIYNASRHGESRIMEREAGGGLDIAATAAGGCSVTATATVADTKMAMATEPSMKGLPMALEENGCDGRLKGEEFAAATTTPDGGGSKTSAELSDEGGVDPPALVWVCDACRVAVFDDYYDACRHEKACHDVGEIIGGGPDHVEEVAAPPLTPAGEGGDSGGGGGPTDTRSSVSMPAEDEGTRTARGVAGGFYEQEEADPSALSSPSLGAVEDPPLPAAATLAINVAPKNPSCLDVNASDSLPPVRTWRAAQVAPASPIPGGRIDTIPAAVRRATARRKLRRAERAVKSQAETNDAAVASAPRSASDATNAGEDTGSSVVGGTGQRGVVDPLLPRSGSGSGSLPVRSGDLLETAVGPPSDPWLTPEGADISSISSPDDGLPPPPQPALSPHLKCAAVEGWSPPQSSKPKPNAKPERGPDTPTRHTHLWSGRNDASLSMSTATVMSTTFESGSDDDEGSSDGGYTGGGSSAYVKDEHGRSDSGPGSPPPDVTVRQRHKE